MTKDGVFAGTVIRLFDRGYGYIEADPMGAQVVDPEGKGIFFHALALVGREFDRLRIGAKVEFEVVEDARGPRAVDVDVIENGDGEGIRKRGVAR